MKKQFLHNKGAVQLRGSCASVQCLCFCYIDTCSTIPLFPKSKIPVRPGLCIVKDPVDRFSHYVVQMSATTALLFKTSQKTK